MSKVFNYLIITLTLYYYSVLLIIPNRNISKNVLSLYLIIDHTCYMFTVRGPIIESMAKTVLELVY